MAYISNSTQKTANSTPMYGSFKKSPVFEPFPWNKKGNAMTKSGKPAPIFSLSPQKSGLSTPVDTTVEKVTNGLVTKPTTTTSTLPYTPPKQSQGLVTAQPSAPIDTKTKGLLTPPKQEPSSFAKFTAGLMDSSQPSKAQRDYLRKLEAQSKKGEIAARRAEDISNMYGSEIARVGNLGAGAVAGAKSTGTDVVGRGNAAIAAESASNRISALSAAQAAALQGTGQQLTAAEQGITGLTNTLTGANTQQQLAQQALQFGGQLAQPSVAQYGQTVFDPTTGQYTGGSLDPQQQAGSLAQQVMSGRMTYDQALASLGYAGQAGTNFLNNALTQAGGNPLQLQAQSAGQQANIATQTTAGTDIARQNLGGAVQTYVDATAFVSAAKQQGQRALSILQQTGLNNVSSTDYNKAANQLRGRFGDENFAAYQSALEEAKNFYTSVLSTGGGTPSGQQAIADSIAALNTATPIGAVVASLGELEAAASNRLNALSGIVNQYQQNLGSGATNVGGGGGFAEAW